MLRRTQNEDMPGGQQASPRVPLRTSPKRSGSIRTETRVTSFEVLPAHADEPRKAIADFDKAIRRNRKHASYFYERGVALLETKNYDKAIDDFDVVIQQNPIDIEALKQRGRRGVPRKTTSRRSRISARRSVLILAIPGSGLIVAMPGNPRENMTMPSPTIAKPFV